MAQRKGGDKGQKGGENPQTAFDFSGKDAPMLAGLQQKLGQLIGQSSGYLETLPQSVQNRITALKHLHKERATLEKQFNKELDELEKKYEALYQPFFDRRSDIVSGKSEPKPEEIVEEEKKEPEVKKETEGKKEVAKLPEDVKGIPEFWLQTLIHHEEFGLVITERDIEVMKHLVDLKAVANPESPHGFILEFHFADNEYFEDKVIKKSYFLNENPADGEVMYDHVDSTKIKWKPGKNLTIKKVTKKQGPGPRKGRGRGGRGGNQGGQTVTVEEPCPSFFNFFNPEVGFLLGLEGMGEEFEDDDMAMQEVLEADYDMALDIKEKVIPNAIMYFTGEVAQYGFGDEYEDDDDEEEDEEQDDEEDEEEDEEFQPPQGAQGQQQNPECKQQ